MATMYPSELGPTERGPEGTRGPTPGERVIFQFFKSAAKPDSAWIAWFEPLLGPRRLEPDFLLFHKNVGFVIVEVKDWSIDGIQEANLDHFVICDQGRRQNPEKQIRSYVYALQDQLKELGFTVKEGSQAGRHSIPIASVIAFPNVKRSDYNSATGFRLGDVLSEKMLLVACFPSEEVGQSGDLI